MFLPSSVPIISFLLHVFSSILPTRDSVTRAIVYDAHLYPNFVPSQPASTYLHISVNYTDNTVTRITNDVISRWHSTFETIETVPLHVFHGTQATVRNESERITRNTNRWPWLWSTDCSTVRKIFSRKPCPCLDRKLRHLRVHILQGNVVCRTKRGIRTERFFFSPS